MSIQVTASRREEARQVGDGDVLVLRHLVGPVVMTRMSGRCPPVLDDERAGHGADGRVPLLEQAIHHGCAPRVRSMLHRRGRSHNHDRAGGGRRQAPDQPRCACDAGREAPARDHRSRGAVRRGARSQSGQAVGCGRPPPFAAVPPPALARSAHDARDVHPFAADEGGILAREIHEHGGERGVRLQVVEHDLVVRVALGVPGLGAVVPAERAEREGGQTGAREGGVVAARRPTASPRRRSGSATGTRPAGARDSRAGGRRRSPSPRRPAARRGRCRCPG